MIKNKDELASFIGASRIKSLLSKNLFSGLSGISDQTLESLLIALIASPPQNQKRGVLCLLVDEKSAKQAAGLTRFWSKQLDLRLPVFLFPEDKNQIISSFLLGQEQIVFSSFANSLAPLLINKQGLERQSLVFDQDSLFSLTEIKQQLLSLGYQRNKQAGQPGEFSVRGEIIDIFLTGAAEPARLVLSGSSIESIKQFSFKTKADLHQLDSLTVPPQEIPAGPAMLLNYLPPNSLVILQNLEEIKSQLPKKEFLELKRVQEKFKTFDFHFFPSSQNGILELELKSIPRFFGQDKKLLAFLNEQKSKKHKTLIITSRPKIINSCLANIKNHGAYFKVLESTPGATGFIWPDQKLAVISDQEIFKRPFRQQNLKKDGQADFLSSIKEGDLVVHLDHGIGRFVGTCENILEGIKKEYFCLGYAEGDKLFVPIETAEKLSKYVGSANPKLHRLHGSSWHSIKQKAARDTLQFARKLLLRQAEREVVKGKALKGSVPEEKQLADSFDFEETADQETVIQEVVSDLEKTRPMDRLIVGDVGFGKTEIAVRAAFKAVLAAAQVVVLAPTTVLAQQHYDTFCARLKGFACDISILSRFQSKPEQKKTVERIKKGTCDIVIGTHRLLQKDIKFANLGLVIIDEEQRFGVAQKEILKRFQPAVHVLTLTATPIPRTLHLSLAGLRNISVICTPPQGRLPIATAIHQFSPEIIKKAIEEEIARQGQVYYLHNDIGTIAPTTDWLKKLVPKARIVFGHGQMPEHELMEIFQKFDNNQIDVLVSTTIIENGLDLPNVNTLIVEEATEFGLAQLYQLRGRIGRGCRQAYAYFFYKSHKLSGDAKKRLRALLEANELGTGYELARRDMEIRGIGNIIGLEQHGNACAIGLHLYTSLLAQAITEIKTGERPEPIRDIAIDLPLEVRIPLSFESNPIKRIKLYQQLSRIRELAELKKAAKLMAHKKELPRVVENLFDLLEIRILAQKSNIASIDTVVKREDGILKRIAIFKYLKPLGKETLDQLDKISERWSLGNFQAKIALDQLGKDWIKKIKQIVNIFK